MNICQQCKQPLKGRKDKKFCNEYCKAAYHNHSRQQKEDVVNEVNKILKANWKILSRINPQGKSTLRKEYLKAAGYDFNYFTNIYRTQKGQVYYFCYNIGLTEVSKTHVCLVNWQEYMKAFQHPIGILDADIEE